MKVDYRSTNPQVPGTGTAFACVLDRGEGANGTTDGAGDVGLVAALDGPYAPNGLFGAGAYVNAGFVQGNIQAHSCHE